MNSTEKPLQKNNIKNNMIKQLIYSGMCVMRKPPKRFVRNGKYKEYAYIRRTN